MIPTPLQKVGGFFFKREDLNRTGSAKDRSILPMVRDLLSKHYRLAALSSSGNAAISAIHYCRASKIQLHLFLSPKTSPSKLKPIIQSSATVTLTDQPNSQAIKFTKVHQAYLLRQSTNPIAIAGYGQIAQEIIDQLPQTTSIFIPVGSGATLLGIGRQLPSSVKLFAVQPFAHSQISSAFDHRPIDLEPNLTDSLSVKFLPLKTQIISLINRSSGSGLIISNSEIQHHRKILKDLGIHTSLEGALTFAGLSRANVLDLHPGSHPVILLTGADR